MFGCGEGYPAAGGGVDVCWKRAEAVFNLCVYHARVPRFPKWPAAEEFLGFGLGGPHVPAAGGRCDEIRDWVEETLVGFFNDGVDAYDGCKEGGVAQGALEDALPAHGVTDTEARGGHMRGEVGYHGFDVPGVVVPACYFGG